MFRYAYPTAQSAVADTPKAAANPEAATAAALDAAFTVVTAPFGGARS
ncbi:hypothetical protein [Streptomyces sp. NPDC057428]